MHWQVIPFMFPLLCSVTLLVGLAWASWQRRPAPGAASAAVLCLLLLEWTLSYLLELSSTQLSTKLLLVKIEYLSIPLVPVCWLLFIGQFNGWDLRQRRILLLFVIPLLTTVLMWTNEWHHLLYRKAWLTDAHAYYMLTVTHGPWYWLLVAYSYILVTAGILLCLQGMLRPLFIYRRQATILLGGAIVPWVCNLLFVFGLNPVKPFDLTTLGFTFTALSMVFGLWRFRLFDIMPIARSAVIEGMRDAVFVLDDKRRIIDLNHMAQRVIGLRASQVIGKPAEVTLGSLQEMISAADGLSEHRFEVMLARNGMRRSFDVRMSALMQREHEVQGFLIVMHDITELKRAEERLARLNECLSSLGADAPANIDRLTELCGELIGAECALYYRMSHDTIIAVGQWRMPDDFLERENTEGHLCRDITRRGSELVVLRNLRQSDYAHLDSNVEKYTLQTCIGKPVTARGVDKGSLCVFFQCDYLPSADDTRVLGIIASAIGAEEERLDSDAVIKESEARYRLLFNTMCEGFLLGSLVYKQCEPIDFRIIDVNPTSEHLIGLPRAELCGRLLSEVFPHLDASWLRALAQVDHTGAPANFQHFVHALHKYLDVSVYRPQTEMLALLLYDITERKTAEERLNYLAYYDELTDLPNRFLFGDRLNQALSYANRKNNSLAVLFLDLDRFKEVNDSLGHEAGDSLLRQVAIRLKDAIRESDTVARLAGDEFVFILPDLVTPTVDNARVMADRILAAFTHPFLVEEHELFLTPSLGIALAPSDGQFADVLMRHADMAMYRAKEHGGNTYCFFAAEMSDTLSTRIHLAHDLHKALERNEFELYYQPQADVLTGETTSIEALLRWHHPTQGLVLPMQFIPVAEETGRIEAIGEWVLHTACHQTRDWQQRFGRNLRVAVNISPRQFERDNFVRVVDRALRDSQLAPEFLELEITESIAMRNTEYTIAMLHQLRALGVRIAIDDFGVGHCSFGYLKRFPIDTLKIDWAFVRDIHTDADNAAIVQAITVLGRALNLNLIAECVEHSEQLEVLRAQGCSNYQGYLLSVPLPGADFDRFMHAMLDRDKLPLVL